MPIYEYQCKSCGHVFDILQKVNADLLTDCPECGKPELRKLVSAPNFRLKGGGWYETDFKTGNRRNVIDAPDSASASKSDGKGDKGDKGEKKDKAPAAKEVKPKGTSGKGSGKSGNT